MAPIVDARPVAIEGRVFDAAGLPVAGAVVVSSAGGSTVSESDGWFHLEAASARGARSSRSRRPRPRADEL